MPQLPNVSALLPLFIFAFYLSLLDMALGLASHNSFFTCYQVRWATLDARAVLLMCAKRGWVRSPAYFCCNTCTVLGRCRLENDLYTVMDIIADFHCSFFNDTEYVTDIKRIHTTGERQFVLLCNLFFPPSLPLLPRPAFLLFQWGK